MSRRPSRNVALLGVALLAVVVMFIAYRNWKVGAPYQAPSWSPTGQYYVQKFSNPTISGLVPGMPGQGSDAIDGYIRIYNKNGRLIHERFERFIRDVVPLWDGNRVFLRGVAAMDNDPWILPSSSE
jgi:hypothetical protein